MQALTIRTVPFAMHAPPMVVTRLDNPAPVFDI